MTQATQGAGEFAILDKLFDFLSSEPATKKEFLTSDLRVKGEKEITHLWSEGAKRIAIHVISEDDFYIITR